MIREASSKGPTRNRPPSRVPSALLAAGLLVSLGISFVWLGGRQYVLLHYYDQIQEIESDLIGLQRETAELTQRFEAGNSDPFWTENIARERMNFSAPGELIFRFPEGG
jgi:cell division protein FtsB